MKSSLCNATKWQLQKGSDTFYLKVPNKPENGELVRALKQAAEPCAWYSDLTGKGQDALQWHLSKKTHANLWRAKTREPLQ